MTNKQIITAIIDCFSRGNKLLIIGNGGSAAMSSHMAAEFINKFEHDRIPLPALALTTDMANITSIANDYSYLDVFTRQVQALGEEGDILIIFTTSLGVQEYHSKNLFNAVIAASKKGIHEIYAPRVGTSTAHIQENQLKWMHDIVREVEKAFI